MKIMYLCFSKFPKANIWTDWKKNWNIEQLATLLVVATWIFDPPNQLTWMAK